MAVQKATEKAERALVRGILDGLYPVGSDLPGERELCKQIGVARPALRVALNRLGHDGWVLIRQGKPTRVNDFMREGNLLVLISLLETNPTLLPGFVPNLLELWGLVAPVYTRAAILKEPRVIAELLWGYAGLDDRPEPYVRAMWRLHRILLDFSGNPITGLIFNSFTEFYHRLAEQSFGDPEMRADARALWGAMLTATQDGDAAAAAALMADYIHRLRQYWGTEEVRAWLESAGAPAEDEPKEGEKPHRRARSAQKDTEKD